METFQVVYRGQNLMRLSISQKYGPYAVMDCFLALVRCWKECGDQGWWGPESFETTTRIYNNQFKVYSVDDDEEWEEVV